MALRFSANRFSKAFTLGRTRAFQLRPISKGDPSPLAPVPSPARPTSVAYPASPTALSSGPHEDEPLPLIKHGWFDPTSREYLENEAVKLSKLAAGCLIVFLGTWASIYFGNQWRLEASFMNAPASIWELEGEDLERTAANWGWELENEDWTGGLEGGTSALFTRWERAMLRSGWQALHWGIELSKDALEKQEFQNSVTGVNLGGQDIGGMIGIAKDAGAFATGDMRRGDLAVAENYLVLVMSRANEAGVPFPPPLAASSALLPLPPLVARSPRRLRPPDSRGLLLLLRHAEVMEQMATTEAMRASKELYERILRHVVDFHGAQTLEARLAKKVADLGRLVGDPKAEDWLVWGISRAVDWDGKLPEGRTPVILPPPTTLPVVPPVKSSWWRSKSAAMPSEVEDSPLLPRAASSSILAPPVEYLLSTSAASSLPPARTRALVNLLSSLSTIQSRPETLSSAMSTQLATLDFISASLASSSTASPPPASSLPHELHDLTLQLASAVISLHLAEVIFASRPRSDSSASRTSHSRSLEWLYSSLSKSASVLHALALPPSTPLPETFPFPSSALPIALSKTLSSVPLLTAPAEQLYTSARRTAASACDLLGVLALRAPELSPSKRPDELFAAAMTYLDVPPPKEGKDAGGGKLEWSFENILWGDLKKQEREVEERMKGEWAKYHKSWLAARERLGLERESGVAV